MWSMKIVISANPRQKSIALACRIPLAASHPARSSAARLRTMQRLHAPGNPPFGRRTP
jgi:hypothetical protein